MALDNSETEVEVPESNSMRIAAPGKDIFEWASVAIAVLIVVLLILSFLPTDLGGTALEILNSNLLITLIGAVVAPWIAKSAKDKIGLDISNSEIQDLLNGIQKAAQLTRDEYDKKRNDDGSLSEEDKKAAKSIAREHLETILGADKYNKILTKVGDQSIELAINEYVKSEWHNRYPIEKEYVKELVTVAVNMIPKLKDWNDLTKEAQKQIIEEAFSNLKVLLGGVGIHGWGKNVLEAFITAELNSSPM